MKGLRRKTALIMAFLFVLAALTACGQKGRLRIGTAGEGGNYNSLGKALSQTLQKDPYKINVEVKTTAGSAANIRLLSQDYLELAIAQSDVIDEMYAGTLDTQAMKGYSAIASLYPEPVQIVVRADSGIASVSDLAGKKVSVGEADSGTQKNAAQILQVYGLTSNMLTVQNMTYAEASKALGDGSIDAMFCTAGAPAQVITDLSGTTPVSLVPIEGQQSDLLTGAYGFYAKAVIPAGTYKGQDSDVTTLAVMSVLLASDKTPADKIYTITGALFKEKAALNDAVPVEFDLQEQKAVESVTIPFHPGAAQYYQECGITVQTSGE
ncbi:MAG: TAXI family TRAP transporter solute-binding subunit [Lachnospiraceae bacterium]|nr:TAXI family TRAP transporter solute-binding subunit [Lachnospiraceae bacterium]MBQ8328314.1 TAXI family TRAP transporter solute-binding subunit [Lachnospiraceae bacterium]